MTIREPGQSSLMNLLSMQDLSSTNSDEMNDIFALLNVTFYLQLSKKNFFSYRYVMVLHFTHRTIKQQFSKRIKYKHEECLSLSQIIKQ